MELVFNLISSFPTIIYSVPLLVCLILLMFSMLGVFDMDMLDIDIDADVGVAGLLATFGLTGVPITLSFSLLFLFAWSLTLFSSGWLLPLIPADYLIRIATAIAVLIFSFIIAVFLTGKITRPLSGLFVTHEARGNASLVSSVCKITSLKVNQEFGQAIVEDGGAGMIISVRSDQEDSFVKGDRGLIYEYDSEKNVYFILKQDK